MFAKPSVASAHIFVPSLLRCTRGAVAIPALATGASWIRRLTAAPRWARSVAAVAAARSPAAPTLSRITLFRCSRTETTCRPKATSSLLGGQTRCFASTAGAENTPEGKTGAASDQRMSLSEMSDAARQIESIVKLVADKIERDGVVARMAELERQMEATDFWDDPNKATKVSQKHAECKARVTQVAALQQECASGLELAEMAQAEEAETGSDEMLVECSDSMTKLLRQAQRMELLMVFADPEDQLDCFLEINAGAGGKEAQDFASMLLKMYSRWADQSGYSAEVADVHHTDAGIKSAVLEVRGENMYGWLKSEQGTHRLVRVSKHDASGRRHTCFANVIVIPKPSSDSAGGAGKVTIDPKDLRIETYRASGPGGQHVNTTDSAVRIVHVPTGLIAQSQSGRSQHANKASALAMLTARLAEAERRRQRDELQSRRAEAGEGTWGNQIRSYVLNPYQMVKDHRTGHECPQAEMVLDGQPQMLTPFMESLLQAALIAQREEPENE